MSVTLSLLCDDLRSRPDDEADNANGEGRTPREVRKNCTVDIKANGLAVQRKHGTCGKPNVSGKHHTRKSSFLR